MAEQSFPGVYAAVLIRGPATTRRNVKDTLARLRLGRVHSCAILPADGVNAGMLEKVADHVTWGEIDKDTLGRLLEKRGRDPGGAVLDRKKAGSIAAKLMKGEKPASAGMNPVFRLAPPSGGMRSIRLRYPRGDGGYRGGAINELIERMM